MVIFVTFVDVVVSLLPHHFVKWDRPWLCVLWVHFIYLYVFFQDFLSVFLFVCLFGKLNTVDGPKIVTVCLCTCVHVSPVPVSVL